MRCAKCGHEVEENVGKCAYCGEESAKGVRVISAKEVIDYDGVTIDTSDEERRANRQNYGGSQKIYVKKINMGNSSWLSKILMFAALAAIAAFLLFVALPIALIGIGIGIVVWMILSFMRG